MANVLSTNEFIANVEGGDGVYVVDFFATWCGPCKMLAPVFEEVASDMGAQIGFGKVDIDESLDIARKYNVSTVPTIIIFKGGEPVETMVGFMPKESLITKLKAYV
ncbi:thioredoxin [Faecalimicrobium sp. JNUCC 81]